MTDPDDEDPPWQTLGDVNIATASGTMLPLPVRYRQFPGGQVELDVLMPGAIAEADYPVIKDLLIQGLLMKGLINHQNPEKLN